MPSRELSRAVENLQISWCGQEAAQVVLELTRASFAGQETLEPPSGATRETLETVEADLVAGRGVLAELGGKPVAAARVLIFDDHLHVRRLGVHPDFRRLGLASAIMRWLQDQSSRLGHDHMTLGVRKALPSNQSLYEKLGYYQVKDHDFWVELRFDLRPQRDRLSTHS
jgi:tRNA threonylcarbamoyladenosine biosynthesis protein TsaE